MHNFSVTCSACLVMSALLSDRVMGKSDGRSEMEADVKMTPDAPIGLLTQTGQKSVIEVIRGGR